MKIQFTHGYKYIISLENLLEAWREFVRGKRFRKDVQEFELNLMSNIISLHNDLADKTYRHSPYQAFNISDPKPRKIHKASVRDRLLHHAIYRILYPFFDKTFISDSFSCRREKGTHKALNRFREFIYVVSKNNTKTCWVLRGDIRKFFASIDHGVLINILKMYIGDQNIMGLLEGIIKSFSSARLGVGLPLGNLTSQLLVNIYMNDFDQFVKHKLGAKYYIRYADDFVFLSEDINLLQQQVELVRNFLYEKLRLGLHPQKLFIKTAVSGVDFLGWVHFPSYRILRTTSKRRIIKRMQEPLTSETPYSYLGLLKHGNTQKLQKEIAKMYFLNTIDT